MNLLEGALWELICHHTYKWHGLATDLSVYDSHGRTDGLTTSDFRQDGATPGSGAWQFHSNGGVAIAVNPGWRPLVGVRVEITARLTTIGSHNQVLIDAHKAFKVYVFDRTVYAAFRGNPAEYPTGLWDSRGTGSGIDSKFGGGPLTPGYRLTANKWVRMLFEHNGMTQLRLLIDDEPVTMPRAVLSGIPGVGPKGIRIGNAVEGGDQPFDGEIDEVKVWRLDPNRVRKQFVDRPLDAATADCWARYVQSLSAAFRKHPDCAKKLISQIRAGMDGWLRAIVSQGPETRQRFDEVRERYAELWRQGRLDGPEMRKLLRGWCAWLQLVGIDPCGGEAAQTIRQSECWRLIQRELAGIECDPQVLALIGLFGEECGCSAESSNVSEEKLYPATPERG